MFCRYFLWIYLFHLFSVSFLLFLQEFIYFTSVFSFSFYSVCYLRYLSVLQDFIHLFFYVYLFRLFSAISFLFFFTRLHIYFTCIISSVSHVPRQRPSAFPEFTLHRRVCLPTHLDSTFPRLHSHPPPYSLPSHPPANLSAFQPTSPLAADGRAVLSLAELSLLSSLVWEC